jgi:adenosylcobinamide kinase/adenosylcobinamide-phosphate guanylyltransferase
MSHVFFITGGARSGKSCLAEEITLHYGTPVAYIATAGAGDEEMSARIAKHQSRRGAGWCTIEEQLDLPKAIHDADGRFNAILVDCITLWVTNLLFYYEEKQPEHDLSEMIMPELERLIATLRKTTTPVIIVSNEVGMGIVPDNRLARIFRDIAGEANKLLADAADVMYVMFSGQPLQLKGCSSFSVLKGDQ